MLNKWETVSLIGTVMGLIIMLFSYIKMRKISKCLKQMNENEAVPEDIVANLFKYQKVLILGMLIAAFAEITGRLLR